MPRASRPGSGSLRLPERRQVQGEQAWHLCVLPVALSPAPSPALIQVLPPAVSCLRLLRGDLYVWASEIPLSE